MAEASTTHTQAGLERPIAPRQPEVRRSLWERLALISILLLAVLMDFYKLGQDGFDTYYPAAIRSMMDSWHNFFFVAYDPGGFTSIDKPPVGFWFQVLSAKIFGFNTVSVLLPQALCGVLSVLLLYYLVKHHFDVVAGLVAALALAISPVSVVTNRNSTIDSMLALTLLLGAWAVLRAAETGKLRWLLLTAVIVGIGFNIKMLEAYLVVPAFGLLYLLAAPTSIRKRMLHLALALLVLLAISLSWIMAVDLTPTSQRPYVGNTRDDSELSLALGVNGLQRLLAVGNGNPTQTQIPNGNNGQTPAPSGQQPSGVSGQQPATQILSDTEGNPGPLRLFTAEPLAGQVAWFLPLALLGIVALAWQGRPRPREDRRIHALILWGMWLLTMGAFFSVAGFFHEYYLTVMAPAVAALCGIGLVTMWRDYRAGGWRAWLLPVSLLLTVAEQIVILTSYPTWGLWMIPLLTIPCLLVAVVLSFALLPVRLPGREQMARFLLPVLAVGLTALTFAPAVWAALPILQGAELDAPLAGPAQEGPTALTLTGGQTTVDPLLVQYLEAHQGHARMLIVTDATNTDGLILATNKPVMPLTGFSSYPLTGNEAASMVASGTVRFFLLTEGGGAVAGTLASVTSWVQQHCGTVPPNLWQSSSPNAQADGNVAPGVSISLQLYDCATPPAAPR
ncbi:MAG TPA: glycosyltransferase family 39 protein [Ktedonobacteraceae bacterium]